MPRRVRMDLSYFIVDCDIFSAKSRLKPLLRRFKADGLAVFIHVLCDVYGTGYYFKPDDYEDYLFEVAEDCGMSVKKVQLILAFMADRTLLDAFSLNKNTVFTSHGIQKRYVEAMKGRKRNVAEIRGEHWLLTEKEEAELDTFYKCTKNAGKSEINDDKSEINDDKSEIYNTTEQNRTEQKYNNTHRERACDERNVFEATLNDFCDKWNITLDTESPSLSEIDFEKLNKAYGESAKFLQVAPIARTISWIIKNIASIYAGKYKDKNETDTRSKSAQAIRTHNYSQDELDAMVDKIEDLDF